MKKISPTHLKNVDEIKAAEEKRGRITEEVGKKKESKLRREGKQSDRPCINRVGNERVREERGASHLDERKKGRQEINGERGCL